MNAIRQATQTATALAHVIVSKVLGEPVQFQHLDHAPATVYCIPNTVSDAYGDYGKMKAGDKTGVCYIGLQTGFDGSVVHGDEITLLGSNYRVGTPIESDALGAVYTLHLSLKTARQV